jgi:hypothetical protein
VHGIHQRGIGSYGPSHDIRGVLKVDNDNIALFAHLIADADVLFRLHGQRSKPDGLGINPESAQLIKYKTREKKS